MKSTKLDGLRLGPWHLRKGCSRMAKLVEISREFQASSEQEEYWTSQDSLVIPGNLGFRSAYQGRNEEEDWLRKWI